MAATELHVAGGYQPLMRMVGLDADAIFSHPDIKVWRKLSDRENCTLDADLPDARKVRLHVKRYEPAGPQTPADAEVRGFKLLAAEGIPTAPLVGWGGLADGRSFVIFEDLAGYTPADKLVEAGMPFQRLLEPTADLAARLHARGLHHRDLYLCHFMARTADAAQGADSVDLKLIDAARVARLPGALTRFRWVVKDLAQFWYSTMKLPVTNEQRSAWLARYARERQLAGCVLGRLHRCVERKVRSIARHDRKLDRSEPTRNVSIPRT